MSLASDSLRRERLAAYLRNTIAQVLRLDAAEVDPARAVIDMGFDSLMAVELRNRIECDLAVTLSATMVFSYPTIESLGPALARMMDLYLEDESETDEVPSEDRAREIAELQELSEEEASVLLLEEVGDLPGEFVQGS